MAILVLPRTLDAPVEKLPDIGPTNAKRLERLGIRTIRDLLLTLPFAWEAYGGPTAVADLHKEAVAVLAALEADMTELKDAESKKDQGAEASALRLTTQDAQRLVKVGSQFTARGY